MSSKSPEWSTTANRSFIESSMFVVRRWKITAILIALLLLFIAIFPSDRHRSISSSWMHNRVGDHTPDSNPISSGGIGNTTLGFQKIYAIGMKGRTDKSDALELAASITDLDITWSEGVPVSDVSPKSYPDTWDVPADFSALGAWRAHMNVLFKIVKERIQTALILEDDTDWDVTLKEQLLVYASSVRTLQNSDDAVSPYGSKWDVQWLGHCRSGPNGRRQPVVVIHDDSTVPPVPMRRSLWRHVAVPDYIVSNTSRVVFDCHAAMCSHAYAVTFNGAQKILSALSTSPYYAPFDVALSGMCANRYLSPFKCYSIYPPLMSSHRFAGGLGRDSDLIDRTRNISHPEHTYDIVYSTMMNTKQMITGNTFVNSQWPNDTVSQTRNLAESYLDEIKTEVREMIWAQEQTPTIKGINSLQ